MAIFLAAFLKAAIPGIAIAMIAVGAIGLMRRRYRPRYNEETMKALVRGAVEDNLYTEQFRGTTRT